MAKKSASWSKIDSSKVLPASFYQRKTTEVAQDLLGKVVVVGRRAGRIVETEAYHGGDPASHSARGKTKRCAPMFEAGGIAYVYFIYGMYEMLNFVTEPKDYPGAVLIRALEPLQGEFSRGANGPGKLTRAMGVTRDKHNWKSLQGPKLYVLDDPFVPDEILVSGRVGIREATEKQWRYFVGQNPHVSKVKENKQARPLVGAGRGR